MRANHRLALLLLLLLAAVLAAWGGRTAADSPAAYAIQRKLVAAASEPEDGGVQAVKLEGGVAIAPTVAAIVKAGVPVQGHIGQSLRMS